MDIAFRRLSVDDLPMLHAWLNEPGVVRWWEGADVSWEAVVRDYGTPATPSTEHWIARVDGRDIGWLQCYLAMDDLDETELWWNHDIDLTAAGIEYLIADPGERSRGLGSIVIRQFVVVVVFGLHPEWTQVCAGPFADNVASCRALEKAGFSRVALHDDDEGPCQ